MRVTNTKYDIGTVVYFYALTHEKLRIFEGCVRAFSVTVTEVDNETAKTEIVYSIWYKNSVHITIKLLEQNVFTCRSDALNHLLKAIAKDNGFELSNVQYERQSSDTQHEGEGLTIFKDEELAKCLLARAESIQNAVQSHTNNYETYKQFVEARRVREEMLKGVVAKLKSDDF